MRNGICPSVLSIVGALPEATQAGPEHHRGAGPKVVFHGSLAAAPLPPPAAFETRTDGGMPEFDPRPGSVPIRGHHADYAVKTCPPLLGEHHKPFRFRSRMAWPSCCWRAPIVVALRPTCVSAAPFIPHKRSRSPFPLHCPRQDGALQHPEPHPARSHAGHSVHAVDRIDPPYHWSYGRSYRRPIFSISFRRCRSGRGLQCHRAA